MSQDWVVRIENEGDYDAIDRVIVAASGEPETAEIVRNLRDDGDALVSLVAEGAPGVLGHIMMSRILIEGSIDNVAAVALAPLMVAPSSQNRGIGSLLTRDALQWCRDDGENIVLVLGHPTYYRRFGFSSEFAERLETPFELAVQGAFMGLELNPGTQTDISGRVKYPRAFVLPVEWTIPR